MIKILKKIRDVLYDISFTFEKLADKVDSAIIKRGKASPTMQPGYRELLREYLDASFPQKPEEQKHVKLEWRKIENFGELNTEIVYKPKETEPQKIEHNSLCETETYKMGTDKRKEKNDG